MIDFFSRLDKYLKHKGLNDNKLTIEVGISNGLIGKARKRGSLSQENISKILYYFPELDANWLLTGKGEMLKKPINEYIIQVNEKDEHYGLDYKEMYFDAKYTIEVQKKYIEGLESQLNSKRKAG